MTGNTLKQLRTEKYHESQKKFYMDRLGYNSYNYGSKLEGNKNRLIPERADRHIKFVLALMDKVSEMEK